MKTPSTSSFQSRPPGTGGFCPLAWSCSDMVTLQPEPWEGSREVNELPDDLAEDPKELVLDPKEFVVGPKELVLDPKVVAEEPKELLENPVGALEDPGALVGFPNEVEDDPKLFVGDSKNVDNPKVLAREMEDDSVDATEDPNDCAFVV